MNDYTLLIIFVIAYPIISFVLIRCLCGCSKAGKRQSELLKRQIEEQHIQEFKNRRRTG